MPRPRTVSYQRPDVELPQAASDGQIYVTVPTAAAITGVHRRTVLTWISNEWLEEAGRDDAGQILLRYRDVIRADGRARNVMTAA